MNLERARMMAQDLFYHHGLAQQGWRFEFDRATQRIGCCMFWKKLITVSGPLAEINSEDIVLDTILHEIAHALAGHEAKHGRMWQVMARSIGAKAERCADISEVVQVEKPYAGTCGDCGAVVYRSRRPGPNMLLTGYHSPCSRKVNKGRITWKHNGISFGTPIVWR